MESQCIIQPRRLIDFLQDQNLPFPRHPTRKSTISSLIHAAVKSSNILRRRFSVKTRSPRSSLEPTMSRTTSVTVKDILRWKSFRDLSEPVEKHVPTTYDFTFEPPSTTRTSSGSDFTVGDSPLWCRGSSQLHVNPKGKIETEHEEEEEDDEEQFSPISVLDFTKEADLIGRNLMLKQPRVQDHRIINKNEHLDDVESFIIDEKAVELTDRVKTTSSSEEFDEINKSLLLDFFRDELVASKGIKNIESRVLRVAKSWIRGEDDGSLEWEFEGTREVCIRQMEKSRKWNDHEDEQREIGVEIEKLVLNQLLDELTRDLRING